MLASHLIAATAVGAVSGFLCRLALLRIDYRQYPSYPQGYTVHLALAAVASLLGAVGIPALLTGDFAAISFLALAATQFREVRNIERETLLNLEESELVPRGKAYIEGIARVFEARNYMAMAGAFGASLGTAVVGERVDGLWWPVIAGLAIACLVFLWMQRGVQGPHVGDLVEIEVVPIEFDGPFLTVKDVVIMNIGLEEARQRYLEEGIGLLLTPKTPAAKATMSNIGQRQAIAHDAATLVGVTKEIDEPHFTPLVRRNGQTGEVVMAIVPMEHSPEALIEAVKNVPVLEAAVRKPTMAKAGKMVD